MKQKRPAILIGSVGVGLLAILLIINYVRGVENRTQDAERQVQVFTANAEIAEGQPGEQALSTGAIKSSAVSNQFRPSDAVTVEEQIKGKVALLPIAPNTIITKSMFVSPEEKNLSFQARLSQPGYVAVAIQLDQVRAAGGFISPGDYVNMMLYKVNEAGQGSLSMLYQKVRVLAVGSNVTVGPTGNDEARTASANSGMLTFEVPQEAASLIASAALSGGLYLTLVPDNYVPADVPDISIDNLDSFGGALPGQDPKRRTPYGPNGFDE